MTVKPYKTKCDQWRRENPEDVKRWDTAHGHVIQFGGFRVYCGRCRDCGTPVTTRRNIQAYNWGMTQLGRWPALCEGCRNRNQCERMERHNEGARYRMAELRRTRRQFRDEQFKRLGLPPVRQGIRLGE